MTLLHGLYELDAVAGRLPQQGVRFRPAAAEGGDDNA